MRAVRFHGVGDLRVEELPEPAVAAADEVLVRVRAAGICGSDLHNYRTGQWVARLPVTPGHEFCGEVAAVGEGVRGLAVGDRVVADSRAPCGACVYCRRGEHNLCAAMGYVGEVCDGGFAEFVVLKEASLLKAPADLPWEVAALAEPLGVAMRVVRRLEAGSGAGGPVLIAGAGPIGGLTALLLAHFGHHALYVADRNPARRELVAGLTGAQPVSLDDPAALRRELAIGRAVEATGSAAVLNALLQAVASGGRIAMVGIFHGAAEIDPNLIVEREIELRGCSVFQGEQREALELLPALADRLRKVVTEPIGLDAVPAAYESLIRGESSRLKTILRP